MKFIHTADIHLDSPLTGLSKYEGAPEDECRHATRKALNNLIDIALRERVSFVLIAGDLFDGDWRDYNTGLYFASQMSRLREADIKVYIVSGNHDAASVITKNLTMPENVTFFQTKKAHTIIIDEMGLALHGQGFAHKAENENIALAYPCAKDGYINIGLLHTSLNGRPGHDNYAPCKTDDLVSLGYHYWALGHVHRHEIVNSNPWIVFPGNIQGRHIRECGPKGSVLVEIEEGEITAVEHCTLDVMRWAECIVDVTGCNSDDTLLENISQAISDTNNQNNGMPLAVRIELHGMCGIHSSLLADNDYWINQIRAQISDQSGGRIWVEKIRVLTQVQHERSETDEALGGFFERISNIDTNENTIDDLAISLSDLKNKLPLKEGNLRDLFAFDKPEYSGQIFKDIKAIIFERLFSGETNQ